MMDDNDGQMIFGDLGGLKLPDICLTGEEKPRKNLTQETCPDRGSSPGPLRDRRACHYLAHSGGLLGFSLRFLLFGIFLLETKVKTNHLLLYFLKDLLLLKPYMMLLTISMGLFSIDTYFFEGFSL